MAVQDEVVAILEREGRPDLASLFLAAPELLAALEAILAVTVHGTFGPHTADLHKQAKAAIAKARGE